MKNIYIVDMERCPYVPTDPEYDSWMRRDNGRLEALSKARTAMAQKVNGYLSHPDRNVRNMAIFLEWFLEK